MTEVEKRKKRTKWLNRNPRIKLIKQQRQWISSQKIEDGDDDDDLGGMKPPSNDDGSNDLKVVPRRFK